MLDRTELLEWNMAKSIAQNGINAKKSRITAQFMRNVRRQHSYRRMGALLLDSAVLLDSTFKYDKLVVML